jgi:hypothetical protein
MVVRTMVGEEVFMEEGVVVVETIVVDTMVDTMEDVTTTVVVMVVVVDTMVDMMVEVVVEAIVVEGLVRGPNPIPLIVLIVEKRVMLPKCVGLRVGFVVATITTYSNVVNTYNTQVMANPAPPGQT